MPLRRELLILAALAATQVPVLGADGAVPTTRSRMIDAAGLGKSKEPIVVTSDRLDYDYKSNVVVYHGGVQATQGRLKITSDRLTVTFADSGDGNAAPQGGLALGGGSARLREIVAAGTVRIEDGTRWATGGRAVFDQANRTLVLSENPMLHDGANEVGGDRVIVYLDEDRSVVEGGRKRVKAVLHPDREEKADGVDQARKKADARQTAAEAAR
jgi:lipopolysaccharide export system protein LptA